MGASSGNYQYQPDVSGEEEHVPMISVNGTIRGAKVGAEVKLPRPTIIARLLSSISRLTYRAVRFVLLDG